MSSGVSPIRTSRQRFTAWWKPWTSEWTVAMCFMTFHDFKAVWSRRSVVPRGKRLDPFGSLMKDRSGSNRSVYSVMDSQFFSHVNRWHEMWWYIVLVTSHTMSHSEISCVILYGVVMSAKRWILQSFARPRCCQSCALAFFVMWRRRC